MEFKVTFDMVIKAALFNITGAIFIVVPFVMGIYFYVHNNSKVALVGPIIPVLVLLYIGFSSAGSGYSIDKDILYIQSGSYKKAIDLSGAKVFTTDDGQWKISTRINGLGTNELKTGLFKLRNGKEAVVFMYRGGKEDIVINYANEYYIINTPNSSNLAKALNDKKEKL